MAELFILILSCICILNTRAAELYTFGLLNGCSESLSEFSVKYGEETVGYFNYTQNTFNTTLPDFAGSLSFTEMPDEAERIDLFCVQVLAELKKAYPDQPLNLEPPMTSIYPKTEIHPGEPNKLVCHVSMFFPPPVNVSWRKNLADVTRLSTLGPSYRNPDGTLSMFSTLSFIPEEGDSYSCTVEHPALEEPVTRTCNVEVDQSLVVYPSVVCYVGLGLGLLGVAVGVFFFVKARRLIN